MSMVRSTWLRTVVVVTLAACSETPTDTTEDPQVHDALELMLPIVDRALFVARDTSGTDGRDGHANPAAAEIAPRERPEGGSSEPPPPDAMSSILDPRTNTRFDPGYGQATGQHWYQGNKSRIDTSITVSLEGTSLGSQSAFREQDAWYWLDFGSWKHIYANARFYTDRACGLTAWGNSGHRAWWEAAIPPAVARYGEVSVSTVSDLARQPDCAPDPVAFTGGGSGTTLCYFWIEYDEVTGEVYNVEFLYCEELGG